MKNVAGKKLIALAVSVLAMVFASMVYSHCQIPCGIYDDKARISMIDEHIATIEKSMKQITELSAQSEKNFNQIVRWVQNKENHADYIMEIASDYFMAQRLKPVDKPQGQDYEKYVKQLTLLHGLLVYSTKAKQTTDLSNVEKLRTLLAEFQTVYFEEDIHKH